MGYQYSTQEREQSPTLLPDFETFGPYTVVTCPLCSRQFQHEPMGGQPCPDRCDCGEDLTDEPRERGYFYAWLDGGLDYWSSDPIGPFASEAEAIAAARAETEG